MALSFGHAACTALLLAALPGLSGATSGGWPNSTTRDGGGGCVGCHGAQTAGLGVGISGPNALLPGQMAQYTITVSNITNAAAKVGFNAAVTKLAQQPTFSIPAGEPEATGDGSTQITHSNGMLPLKTPTAQSASYTVNLSMPAGAVFGTVYTLHTTANAGRSATQVGWKHANNFSVTVAPPTPTSLTPNQAAATATTIPLSWVGTQSEHFRVLRKTGSFPTSATDAGATLVYEGPNASATATGLTAATNYFFAAFGKAPAAAIYSASAAQATAATLPPNPTTLTATPASSSEINLSWNGTSAEFRVLGKSGAYPASATDASAEVVYQGSAKMAIDGGLSAGTGYFYRVWGKVAGSAVFSTNHIQATATTTAQPIERHVDAATGSDGGGNNDCSAPASPCRTITRAMLAAGNGDMISVRPGVYDAALGEVFPITFKAGVQLLATGTPDDTFIDGAGDPVQQGLFKSNGNNSANTRIEGFTLRNGLNTPPIQGEVALGGALYISGGNAGVFTVEGNVFRGNEARGYTANGQLGQTGGLGWGGAMAVFSSAVNVRNNVFSGNLARGGAGQFHPGTVKTGNENGGQGAGGALYFAGTGLVINNSFHGNSAIGGDGGTASNGVGSSGQGLGGAVSASGNPAPSFVNNVFSGNSAMTGAGETPDAPIAGALLAPNAVLNSNNLFFANLEGTAASAGDSIGSAAVLSDPRYHAAPSNLRLRVSSPANGAGSAVSAPATDLAGATRPNPPSIGAYEASIVSQTIVFGTAPTLSAGGNAQLAAQGGASGNAVTFAALTPSVCSVAGSQVNGLNPGTCQVSANQAGNIDFSAAPQVTQSFAVLATPSFALSVTRTGSGSGSVLSGPAGIECGAVCSANFAANAQVTLSATPDAGSTFGGWSGGGCSGTGGCVVTLSAAQAVQANFVPLTSFAVSISGAQEVPINGATGAGVGTAVIDPVANTIDYWFDVDGLSGALTGAHFHGPAARGASAGVKLDIGANPFVGTIAYVEADEAALLAGQWYVNYHTATFSSGELRGQLDNLGGLFVLQVARSGDGFGSVTASPPGIDCGSICSTAHSADSVVVLTASAGQGSAFVGWSGACSGSDPVCSVTMSQARNVTAQFDALSAAALQVFADGFE